MPVTEYNKDINGICHKRSGGERIVKTEKMPKSLLSASERGIHSNFRRLRKGTCISDGG